MRYLLPIVLIFVLMFAAQGTHVSAFSLKELLGFGDEKKEEVAAGNQKQNKLDESDVAKQKQSPEEQWAKEVTNEGSASSPLDYKYVYHLFSNMNAQERDNLLNNKESFQKTVENEATNRAVLSAAVENNLLADENTLFLMRRGAENILREVYLKKLIASKLPADFPSDQQVSEYYEKNPTQFELPERIHVWQIF